MERSRRNPIKAKIVDDKQVKVHTMLVIGGRDIDASAVSVRLHGKGNVGAKPKGVSGSERGALLREFLPTTQSDPLNFGCVAGRIARNDAPRSAIAAASVCTFADRGIAHC